ncbi:MAG: hypothetical protein H6Q89_2366 [Myxococcaceae bacterium]|nr:hypothetical protein [Myxococcaceae bacterium]
MNRAGILIALSLTLALAACEKKKEGAAAPAPTAPAPAAVEPAAVAAAPAQPAAAATATDAGQGQTAIAEAEQIFQTRCTVCHGPLGKGDGPGSLGLDPKPRNFTDPKWQAEVTDEYLEKIILYGGLAVGRSAAMPPNSDLAAKPEVIAGIRAHVRSLRGK